MVWQSIVLAVQILLLAAGWLLFQRACGELSARAAETPVLGEVKALQKSVKQLLAEIDAAGEKQSARIERVCSEAASLLAAIESRLHDAEVVLTRFDNSASHGMAGPADTERGHIGLCSSDRDRNGDMDEAERHATHVGLRTDATPVVDGSPAVGLSEAIVNRREIVYSMADNGQSPATIARATRVSEGEVETLLGLRVQR